jgi:hypothetical protein
VISLVLFYPFAHSRVFTHNGISHPSKSMWPDRWYQRVSDSGSYVTWMTLSGHRHYEDSSFSTAWATPITNALNGWNNTDTTISIGDTTPVSSHDVHIVVTNSTTSHLGRALSTNGALGIIYLFDELQHVCDLNAPSSYGDCDANHTRPNTWWYAAVLVDNDAHSGALYGTAYQREASVSHELGHAIVLAHDGLNDSDCGTASVPASVMDYDCLDFGVLKSPTDWDVCGVNHAYDDPTWRDDGCFATYPDPY